MKSKDKFEFFMARRIAFQKRCTACGCDGRSEVMGTVAMWSVVVSMVVMLLSGFIVDGFKEVVSYKVKGLIADYSILPYQPTSNFKGLYTDDSFVEVLRSDKRVESVSAFLQMNGVAKNDGEMSALLLKGVAKDNFIADFYGKHIIEGRFPQLTQHDKEVLISKRMASDLRLKIGDDVEFMFLEDTPMRDKYRVSGIFDTSIDILDGALAVTLIDNVEELMGWDSGRVNGFEVRLKKGFDNNTISDEIAAIVDEYRRPSEGMLLVFDVRRNFPQIFSWLDLQKTNEAVILTIMMIVAAVNMVAMALILLMRKIPMIGSLQVMGATNSTIRKIFLYRTLFIVVKGVVIGVLIAVTLGLAQHYFEIVKLDGKGYFVSSVPIFINYWKLLLTAVATVLVMLVTQWITTCIISSIDPSVSVRFDSK